jgi:hypothetical protein
MPDRIYLQHGEAQEGEEVHDAFLGEVTWCENKVHDSDVPFLRATPKREAAGELRDMLNAVVNTEWATVEQRAAMDAEARAFLARLDAEREP